MMTGVCRQRASLEGDLEAGRGVSLTSTAEQLCLHGFQGARNSFFDTGTLKSPQSVCSVCMISAAFLLKDIDRSKILQLQNIKHRITCTKTHLTNNADTQYERFEAEINKFIANSIKMQSKLFILALLEVSVMIAQVLCVHFSTVFGAYNKFRSNNQWGIALESTPNRSQSNLCKKSIWRIRRTLLLLMLTLRGVKSHSKKLPPSAMPCVRVSWRALLTRPHSSSTRQNPSPRNALSDHSDMLFVPLQTSQLMRSCLTAGLFLLCLYSLTAQTYKQFGLRRVSVDGQGGDCSSGQSVSGRAWRELCYAKDVSYHIELFIDGLLYYVAVDLTTPLSWLKSPDCHAKSKGCSIIQDSQKALAEQQFTDVKVKFRFFGRQSAGRHQQDVAIVGSSDFIAGEMQNVEYAQFFAKDSRSARELTRLLGLSLFLAPEKDRIMLNNVSVMKAQKLSFGVNGMIDGAISVRASLEASSLLAQLFANSQSSHRIVTIYLHPLSKQGILSIGDISLKHTKSRQSQIIWADMHKNLNDAISFRSAGLALTEAFMPSPQTFRVLNSSADVYLTTSSSFIFLPQDWVEQLTAMLKEKTNASCLIAKEGGVFKCKWAGLADKQKALPLAVAVALPFPHISIGIPFTTLILISDGLFIDFAIKLSKTSSVILGQPFFEQYVVFLDYDNNKLGFAHAFFHQYDKFTSILIYFLRLLLFASILLFLAYLCFNPYQQFKRFLTNKLQKLKAHFSKVHYESFNELGESESS